MTNRRPFNDSPDDNSTSKFSFMVEIDLQFSFVRDMFVYRKTSFSTLVVVISSHQLNSIDEQQCHHTTNESLLSGIPHSSVRSQTRPMGASHTYWLTTGDNNNNNNSTSFMRSTYAATSRSYLRRSTERCPRACRGILPVPDLYFSALIQYICVCMLVSSMCVHVLLCFNYSKNTVI